jgi:hypothetical protein
MLCNNYFVASGRLLNKQHVAQTFETAVVQAVEAVAWAVVLRLLNKMFRLLKLLRGRFDKLLSKQLLKLLNKLLLKLLTKILLRQLKKLLVSLLRLLRGGWTSC